MPGSDPSSGESAAKALEERSRRLAERIDDLSRRTGRIPVPEIVDAYFLVMEVRTHAALLGREMEGLDAKSRRRLKEAEGIVSERFDKTIHPVAASQLDASIRERAEELRSMESGGGSAAPDPGLYEGLREMMSTREFVDQYEKGMMHDR